MGNSRSSSAPIIPVNPFATQEKPNYPSHHSATQEKYNYASQPIMNCDEVAKRYGGYVVTEHGGNNRRKPPRGSVPYNSN